MRTWMWLVLLAGFGPGPVLRGQSAAAPSPADVFALEEQGPPPEPPAAYWALPTEVREAATVVLSGTVRVGRGPCEWLPDGSRRWALLRGVSPNVIYRGNVHSDYIGLEDPHIFGLEGDRASLVDGHVYLVLLRPSKHSRALLRAARGSRYHGDAIPNEEVLAVVEQ